MKRVWMFITLAAFAFALGLWLGQGLGCKLSQLLGAHLGRGLDAAALAREFSAKKPPLPLGD